MNRVSKCPEQLGIKSQRASGIQHTISARVGSYCSHMRVAPDGIGSAGPEFMMRHHFYDQRHRIIFTYTNWLASRRDVAAHPRLILFASLFSGHGGEAGKKESHVDGHITHCEFVP